ncbi:MAG: hypothetical protein ACRDFX_13565, partial [Chloroflexota bacterium]
VKTKTTKPAATATMVAPVITGSTKTTHVVKPVAVTKPTHVPSTGGGGTFVYSSPNLAGLTHAAAPQSALPAALPVTGGGGGGNDPGTPLAPLALLGAVAIIAGRLLLGVFKH